jgi:hypothetical protein
VLAEVLAAQFGFRHQILRDQVASVLMELTADLILVETGVAGVDQVDALMFVMLEQIIIQVQYLYLVALVFTAVMKVRV